MNTTSTKATSRGLGSARVVPWRSLAAAACFACGCGNEPPVIEPISDQTAFVNSEFALTVRASDPEGDALGFGFASDIADIASRATLVPASEGAALFRFTPIVSDVGIHAFDFTASDGAGEARATITVTVVSSEGATAPVFIQPLGTGTTIDLETTSCVDVPIVVEDPDTPGVTLGQEEPLIAGADLTQATELTGSWHFCPTAAQVAESDRYTLVLSADDGENEPTLKPYLIVLNTAPKPNCPGSAPVVTHTPEDAASLVDLTIAATVSDDVGIKFEPLLYFSTTPPGNPPNLASMIQLTMLLIDGGPQSGVWAADVPNPVAGQGAGSTAQLYYLIVARDDDDPAQSCFHVTQSPAAGVHQITVTNPGGAGGLPPCAGCSADAQCGAVGDNCVYMGGGYHCFTACTSDNDCLPSYYCSFGLFTSIDGAQARQCIPTSYSCVAPSSCQDDSFEENDSLAQAKTLPSGTSSGLKSCPLAGGGDDEDWYRFTLQADTQVSISLSGGAATDLDLALTASNGAVLEKGDGLTSNESVSACLAAGTYFVHVYAWGQGENTYSLTFTKTTQSCSSCQDDPDENDDNAAQARVVDFATDPYTSNTNAICAWDDDWYEVYMYAGETIYATLSFSQANGSEDLDLLVYRNGVNLTGCSEQTPSNCDPLNGQSGTSDERLEWPIAQEGYYYVVVRGWNGSENLYDICLSYSGACP